ncbi:hypothetical protein EPH_0011940 [Eimeria praecox]|uniref:Uncharacterized protein n=1 Tax=Eimeria praecox TaxID=51316 RepID=U6GWA9_9EIME|nr:hypothetical protein EPH_0011940 [Eimeria praecox]
MEQQGLHLQSGRAVGQITQSQSTVRQLPGLQPIPYRIETSSSISPSKQPEHTDPLPDALPSPMILDTETPVASQYLSALLNLVKSAISAERSSDIPPPMIHEDGSTEQAFLAHFEQVSAKGGIDPMQRGNELTSYLSGPALRHWVYPLKTLNTRFWGIVKGRMLMHFYIDMKNHEVMAECWNKGIRTFTMLTNSNRACTERFGTTVGLPIDSHYGGMPVECYEAQGERTGRGTGDNSAESTEVPRAIYGQEERAAVPPWWREVSAGADFNKVGVLCSVGTTAVIRVDIAGNVYEALLDTGASRSFISSKSVKRLQLKELRLSEEGMFTVANGEQCV